MRKLKWVVAGALFSSTLLGTGTTYALLDSGSTLSNWFDQPFLESTNEIEEAAKKEMDNLLQEISIEVQTASEDVKQQLIKFQMEVSENAKVGINEHNAYSIQQIKAKTESLKKQNEQEMQLYREQLVGKEAAQITEDANAILLELLETQN